MVPNDNHLTSSSLTFADIFVYTFLENKIMGLQETIREYTLVYNTSTIKAIKFYTQLVITDLLSTAAFSSIDDFISSFVCELSQFPLSGTVPENTIPKLFLIGMELDEEHLIDNISHHKDKKIKRLIINMQQLVMITQQSHMSCNKKKLGLNLLTTMTTILMLSEKSFL